MPQQSGNPARPEPTTGTFDELVGAATRAQGFTGGTAAAIGVLTGDIVVCCARSGASAPELGTPMNLAGLARACRSKKEALRCDDTEADARAAGGDWKSWNARSVLMVPVCEGEEVVGLISVFASSPSTFNQVHLAIVKTIADQLKELRKKSENVVRSRSIEIHPGVHEEIKSAEAQPSRPVSVVIAAPPLPPTPEIHTRSAATKPATPSNGNGNGNGHADLVLDLTDAVEEASSRPTLVESSVAPATPPKQHTPVAAKPEHQTPPPATQPASSKTVVLASAPESEATKIAVMPAKPGAPVVAKADPKAAAAAAKAVPAKSAIEPPPLVSQPAKAKSAAATSNSGFTPMSGSAKPIATPPPMKPVPPVSKKRDSEILPAAAEPFEFGMTPTRAPRPTTQTIALTGFENAARGSESGRNKFMIPLGVTAVLAIGFGAWMLRGSMHTAHAASNSVQATISAPAVEPAPVAPATESAETTPPTTVGAPVDAAAQKAPVTIGTLPAPKQATAAAVATLKAVTDSTEVKIPVATETVSASAPKAAIVTTTVVPRAPAASQVVAPPTIASLATAPVPVIAAPVKVVSAAARSTGATSAQVLTQVKPVYPMAAKIMHAQGSATLKVKIAKDGSVSDVQWVNGNSVFKDAALTAVRQWKYKPATLNGEPAEATQEVTLKFLPQ